MAKRKRYTPEYRREAAALVLDTDRPITHVAEEIDVGAQLLGRWVQQERERRGPAPGPDAPLAATEREELKSCGGESTSWKRTTRSWEKQPPSSRRSHPGGTVRADGSGEGELRDHPLSTPAGRDPSGLLCDAPPLAM